MGELIITTEKEVCSVWASNFAWTQLTAEKNIIYLMMRFVSCIVIDALLTICVSARTREARHVAFNIHHDASLTNLLRSPASLVSINIIWRITHCAYWWYSTRCPFCARYWNWNGLVGTRVWYGQCAFAKGNFLMPIAAEMFPSSRVIGTDLSPIQPL